MLLRSQSASLCRKAHTAATKPTAATASWLRRQPVVLPQRGARFLSTTSQCPHQTPSSTGSPSHDPFTTVSPGEVSHFNALASSWWDPHGPSRILHLMNPLRHDFIRSIRASVGDNYIPESPAQPRSPSQSQTNPQGLKYLDIGCGGGIFAESAARLPTTHSVTAIDPTPLVLSIARRHALRDPLLNPSTSPGRLTYINTSIESLPLPASPAEAYDVVSVFEVLEHVNQPAEFLDRCTPFVKPGGWLVMSTIARTWLSWFTTNFMAEDVLRIVPRGTHDWAKYINEHELRQHFAEATSAGAGAGAAGTGVDGATGVVGGGDGQGAVWEAPRCMGVIYIPGVGWREVKGSEKVGNYFFAVRRAVS